MCNDINCLFFKHFQINFVRATETVPEMAFAIRKPEFVIVRRDSTVKAANVSKIIYQK